MTPPDPNRAQPAEPAASAMTPPPEGGWESLKVDELKDELDARGLPKTGKKAELVARLADDDVAQKDNLRAPRGESTEAETTPDEVVPDDGVSEEVVPPDEPAEEPSADEVEKADDAPPAVSEAAGQPAEEDSSPKRRRGSAETSTGTGTRRRPAPRPDADLIVRARSKYVRSAPRKARLVMDHIRGKEVEQARAILGHAPRAVADDILKLLNSAVANAESAYELGPDELRIFKAFVDEGPTIKRFRPRALGRATKINKRTSHMTIELTTTQSNGR
jgi:large subunit ribosomal protein L22